MKTINIRLLVNDNADEEALVEHLARAGHAEVLGAVELLDDGFGRLVSAPQVRTRPNVRWDGNPQGDGR